jgi:hypothetical protein
MNEKLPMNPPREWLDQVLTNSKEVMAVWAWSAKRNAAQQSAHLTALRRGLALSILFNVVLLAVVLATIGGR